MPTLAERRRARRALGRCRDCSTPAEPGRSRCAAHLAAKREENRRRPHAPYDPVYAREQYQRRVEQGLCVTCGRSTAGSGTVRCAGCSQLQVEVGNARVELGLCRNCGRPAVAGKTRCEECLATHAAGRARRGNG